MSENQDIRVWARSQGEDLGDRGRIPQAIRDRYAAAHNGSQPSEPDELPEIDGNDLDFMPPGDPEPAPAPRKDEPKEGRVVPERKPQPVPRKRRGIFNRGEPAKPKSKRDRKPRVSIENLVSSGWGIAAMALARNPRAIPVARILQMQSPVAGVIVDEQLRGTMVDKFLQPFARAGEKGEIAFALAGPPILVGAMTANPQLFPVLKPMLKMSMMSWLTLAGPAQKKVEAKVQAFAEDFGHIDLDGMIDALWADVPVPTTDGPSEQEEANIRRARGE